MQKNVTIFVGRVDNLGRNIWKFLYKNLTIFARKFDAFYKKICQGLQENLIFVRRVDNLGRKIWKFFYKNLTIFAREFDVLGPYGAWYIFVVRDVWMCLKLFIESDTYSLLWWVNLPPNWRTRCDEWTNDTSTQTHFFTHTMREAWCMTHHEYEPLIMWTQLFKKICQGLHENLKSFTEKFWQFLYGKSIIFTEKCDSISGKFDVFSGKPDYFNRKI